MSAADYQRALEVAVAAADAARRIILAECARPDGPRGPRGKCPADTEAEFVIREQLLEAFPSWGYRGEETGYQPPMPGETHIWLVDPNDGTTAMQDGIRGNAVSIGLLCEGRPVLGVVQAVNAPDDDGDLFAWAEGRGPLLRNGQPVEHRPWPTRLNPHDLVLVSPKAEQTPLSNLRWAEPARFLGVASIAYRLALVAAGEGVACLGYSGPVAWDYAGGHALLRAMGGLLLDENGDEVTYDRDGWSSTGACFGGAPEIVSDLVRRDWRGVVSGGYGETAPAPELAPVTLQPGRLLHNSAVLRRAQGCWLGQLAGDALGALVEFQSAARIAACYPDGGPRLLADGGPHQISAGQPTDDSELALMLARTLVQHGEYDREAVGTAYARWYNGWTHALAPCEHGWCRPFDIGTTIGQALCAIGREHAQVGRSAEVAERSASRTSQSNGALMRISPLGIWGWRRDEEVLAEIARADARLTHPHPVCQEASALFVTTIARGIREGSGPAATYERALEWARANRSQRAVIEALERAANGPPPDFLTQQGWVLIALQNAFFRLLHAPTLESAVVDTVRAGGDTDTNAAICGALVGAVQGRAAIPAQWQRMVLSCRPVAGHSAVHQPRPAVFWPTDALALAERLLGSR